MFARHNCRIYRCEHRLSSRPLAVSVLAGECYHLRPPRTAPPTCLDQPGEALAPTAWWLSPRAVNERGVAWGSHVPGDDRNRWSAGRWAAGNIRLFVSERLERRGR